MVTGRPAGCHGEGVVLRGLKHPERDPDEAGIRTEFVDIVTNTKQHGVDETHDIGCVGFCRLVYYFYRLCYYYS